MSHASVQFTTSRPNETSRSHIRLILRSKFQKWAGNHNQPLEFTNKFKNLKFENFDFTEYVFTLLTERINSEPNGLFYFGLDQKIPSRKSRTSQNSRIGIYFSGFLRDIKRRNNIQRSIFTSLKQRMLKSI